MDLIKSLLVQVDPAVLYAVAIILTILIIFAIINKMIKAAITFFVVIAAAVIIILGSNLVKAGYNVDLHDSELVITADGQEFQIEDIKKIDEVIITENDESMQVVIKYMAENIELTMPKYMKHTVSNILAENKINHVFN